MCKGLTEPRCEKIGDVAQLSMQAVKTVIRFTGRDLKWKTSNHLR